MVGKEVHPEAKLLVVLHSGYLQIPLPPLTWASREVGRVQARSSGLNWNIIRLRSISYLNSYSMGNNKVPNRDGVKM